MKNFLILSLSTLLVFGTASAFSLSEFSAQIFSTPSAFSVGTQSLDTIFEHEQSLRLAGDEFLYKGKLKKALQKYDESLRIVPYKFEALYNKACVQALLGKKEEALQTLRLAALIHNYAIDLAIDDSDFESLREMEGFQELVKWIE